MKLSKAQISSIVIILFHIVGFVGFTTSFSELFKQLVPFHLLLMLGLILFSHPVPDRNVKYFLLVIYLAGYLVEWLGVNTGLIFGEYYYETTLGYKVFGIPLLIGVNWILVIYSAGTFINRFKIKSIALKSALAAVLVTFLDFFIEPVAVKYNYWQWPGGGIPLQNYFAWSVVSFLMLILFFKLDIKKSNAAGVTLFITQLCFFIALNIQIN